MIIKVEKIKGGSLKPGDLFVYGDNDDVAKLFKTELGVGVFIRTEQPLPFEDSKYHPVLKVTVEK